MSDVVAPLMTFSGSTTVETPAAFMTRSRTAAVGGEHLKFMPAGDEKPRLSVVSEAVA